MIREYGKDEFSRMCRLVEYLMTWKQIVGIFKKIIISEETTLVKWLEDSKDLSLLYLWL